MPFPVSSFSSTMALREKATAPPALQKESITPAKQPQGSRQVSSSTAKLAAPTYLAVAINQPEALPYKNLKTQRSGDGEVLPAFDYLYKGLPITPLTPLADTLPVNSDTNNFGTSSLSQDTFQKQAPLVTPPTAAESLPLISSPSLPSPVKNKNTPELKAPAALAVTPQALAQAESEALANFQPEEIKTIRAEHYKDKGNELFILGYYDMAISEYLKSLYADPTYTDSYYNLGRIYMLQGDNRRAIEVFRRLLQITPDDLETRVLLANRHIEQGSYAEAIEQYEQALQHDPRFDPAARGKAYLQMQLLSTQQPEVAKQQFNSQAFSTLNQAKELAGNFLRQQRRNEAVELLHNRVMFQFVPTQERKTQSNMAEFDHHFGSHGIIRIRPELAYASPNVLAAYLVHEMVHASDQDAISSVMEEQDAYRLQAQFWLEHNNGVHDSNLDRASNLYREGVDLLDQEVRRSYGDDDLLPEKSPGHGLPHSSDSLLAYNEAKLEKLKTYQMRRIKTLLPF